MKKRKKLKLKKQVYFFLAGIIVVILSVIFGVSFYRDAKYKETLEYQLIKEGYNKDEIALLQSKLKEDEILEDVKSYEKDLLLSLVQEKYFLSKNLKEYVEYNEENEEDYELSDIVAVVNVHAHLKWYQETYETDTSLQEKMIVNKFYELSKDYVPENLKVIPLTYAYGAEGDNQIIDYAYDKFMDLWQAGKDAGYHFMVQSSYRDYEEQESLYNERKASLGERKADETAARPGHSEHQTGLVLDMVSIAHSSGEDFSQSEDYQWLQENAYKYGFIERYPEGKTYLTGYSPESWHWRYVGIEAATICHNENITYDEYYAFYIES